MILLRSKQSLQRLKIALMQHLTLNQIIQATQQRQISRQIQAQVILETQEVQTTRLNQLR